jgi:ankyrin repeat protein
MFLVQYGGTALMHAAHRGHSPVVELLLGANAAVDLQDTVRTGHNADVSVFVRDGCLCADHS